MTDTSGNLGSAAAGGFIGSAFSRLLTGNGINGIDGTLAGHNVLTAADVTTQVGALLSMQDINEVKRDVWQAQAQTNLRIGEASTAEQIGTLNSEIANLQGQSGILAAVNEVKFTTANEVASGAAAVVANANMNASSALATTNALAASLAAGHAAIQAGIADSKYATLVAINADGDQTRALIQSINNADLNRQITVADNRIAELLGDRRTVDSGVTVTNNINQNQLQQQQQQQFTNINTSLACLAAELQRNTQSTVNLGTMVGTTQTASNTRVS